MKIFLDLKALSLNNCYRGRRFSTAAKKQYDRTFQILLPKAVMDGPYYRVVIRFYLKRCFSGDLDNLAKGVLDNLVVRGIVSEDRNVVDIRLLKFPFAKDRMEIDVENVAPCEVVL